MGFRGVAGSASRPALLEQPGECGDVGGGGAAAPADEARAPVEAPGHPVVPQPLITVRPKYSIQMVVHQQV